MCVRACACVCMQRERERGRERGLLSCVIGVPGAIYRGAFSFLHKLGVVMPWDWPSGHQPFEADLTASPVQLCSCCIPLQFVCMQYALTTGHFALGSCAVVLVELLPCAAWWVIATLISRAWSGVAALGGVDSHQFDSQMRSILCAVGCCGSWWWCNEHHYRQLYCPIPYPTHRLLSLDGWTTLSDWAAFRHRDAGSMCSAEVMQQHRGGGISQRACNCECLHRTVRRGLALKTSCLAQFVSLWRLPWNAPDTGIGTDRTVHRRCCC